MWRSAPTGRDAGPPRHRGRWTERSAGRVPPWGGRRDAGSPPRGPVAAGLTASAAFPKRSVATELEYRRDYRSRRSWGLERRGISELRRTPRHLPSHLPGTVSERGGATSILFKCVFGFPCDQVSRSNLN
ncbi:hypothetical protein VULLAG_LOCUS22886 [Vulpes lagopus]